MSMNTVERIDDLSLFVHPGIAAELVKRPATRVTGNEDFAKIRARTTPPPAVEPHDIETEDVTLPGFESDDYEVPVRVYRPRGLKPVNTVIFVHGGGFVGGSVNGADRLCFGFARFARANVVSVDYRMPPDAYPAGVHDCYATLRWIATGPEQLGGLQDRIIMSGSSAGGCLAAGTALLSRDLDGPAISHLLLISPVLDDRHETKSSRMHYDDRNWSSAMSMSCWKLYLGTLNGDDIPIYAAPGRATDLSGLPPTSIFICEYDPLRDEEMLFANRLTASGVATNAFHYGGTCHGCAVWAPDTPVTRRINRDIRETLRAATGATVW